MLAGDTVPRRRQRLLSGQVLPDHRGRRHYAVMAHLIQIRRLVPEDRSVASANKLTPSEVALIQDLHFVEANKRIKWAALVHKNAVDDRLGEWREFVDPEDTTTDDTTSNYRGYLSGLKDGVDVYDKQPPFELVLSSIKHLLAGDRAPVHAVDELVTKTP